MYSKEIFEPEKRGRVFLNMYMDKPLKFPTTSRKNTLVLHLTSSKTEVNNLLEVEVTVVYDPGAEGPLAEDSLLILPSSKKRNRRP